MNYIAHPITKTFFIFLLAVLFPWSEIKADEIRLSNGDLVTGEIIRMEDGLLFLQTRHSGNLKIKWKELSCITSEKNLIFLTTTGKKIMGGIKCPGNGRALLESKRTKRTRETPLSSIRSINPFPQNSFSWKGLVTAGGNRALGNTDTLNFNLSADFETRFKKNRFTITTNFTYGEADDNITARNYLGDIKYDLFLTKRLFWYSNVLLERDDFQDLGLRSILGGGLGVQLLDNKLETFLLETGPSYFMENYKKAKDQAYFVGRWSMKYNLVILDGRLKLFHFHEGYYRIEGGGHYYIRSEQGCRVSLVRNLNANFQMDYKYDNQPAAGKKHYDTVFIIGLGYEFN